MTDYHPITPPPELVREWTQNRGYSCSDELWDYLAAQAAQWGADQELEACCEWLTSKGLDHFPMQGMREARRPTPPSLKEQALDALQFVDEKLKGHLPLHNHCNAIHTISRALEALDD